MPGFLLVLSLLQRLWAHEGGAGEHLHAYAGAALCVLLGKQLSDARGPDELLRIFNDVGRVSKVRTDDLIREMVRIRGVVARKGGKSTDRTQGFQ